MRLREQLASSNIKRLSGKRALITRPAAQAEEFAELLRAEGAEPVIFPLIKIVPTPDTASLEDAVNRLDSFDWLFFTSANGVRTVAPYLKKALSQARASGRFPVKIAAVGPRTAQECEELGLDIAFMPRQYSVEAIAREFPETIAGRRMLLLRAREANPALPEQLRAGGAHVEEIAVYSAEPTDADAAQLRKLLSNGNVDIITLMSSSTVRSLANLLGDDMAQLRKKNIQVACLGHVTAQTFKQATGHAADIQADIYTMQGLIQAIIHSLET